MYINRYMNAPQTFKDTSIDTTEGQMFGESWKNLSLCLKRETRHRSSFQIAQHCCGPAVEASEEYEEDDEEDEDEGGGGGRVGVYTSRGCRKRVEEEQQTAAEEAEKRARQRE